MKQGLIIMDFDHTMFNTTYYVDVLQKQFKKKFGIDKETFLKYRKEVKDCCVVVDMDTFIEKLPYQDKEAMHTLHHKVIKDNAEEFIFQDVNNFLMSHIEKYDIVITTHGDSKLQKEKITHSGLPKEITYIISKKSKDEVIAPYVEEYQKVFFIDDKAANIDAVKTAHPTVETFFMKRPDDSPYGNIESVCECADHVLLNLNIHL